MAYAQTPAAACSNLRQPPAPVPPATAELREAAAKAPTPADLAKRRSRRHPDREHRDVTVTDAKAGPTLADAGNQIGQEQGRDQLRLDPGLRLSSSCSCKRFRHGRVGLTRVKERKFTPT